MGFRYRKSINFGPFRLNVSKSGIGYSVGVKGYRITKKANGGIRKTVSIPGTGISHVTEIPASEVAAAKKSATRKTVPAPQSEEEKGGGLQALIFCAVVVLFIAAAFLIGAALSRS